MKICVTSQGDNLEAQIDPRFGRCQYFIFVETDTMEFEAVSNQNISGMGGVGVQSGQIVSEKGAQVILTGSVGPNAMRTLQAGGVQVMDGLSGTIREAIEQYKRGSLKSTDKPSAQSKAGMQ